MKTRTALAALIAASIAIDLVFFTGFLASDDILYTTAARRLMESGRLWPDAAAHEARLLMIGWCALAGRSSARTSRRWRLRSSCSTRSSSSSPSCSRGHWREPGTPGRRLRRHVPAARRLQHDDPARHPGNRLRRRGLPGDAGRPALTSRRAATPASRAERRGRGPRLPGQGVGPRARSVLRGHGVRLRAIERRARSPRARRRRVRRRFPDGSPPRRGPGDAGPPCPHGVLVLPARRCSSRAAAGAPCRWPHSRSERPTS